MSDARSIAIVGASVAGVSVADALRAGGHGGPITLIDGDPELPYDKPPLSKDALAPDGDVEHHRLRTARHFEDRDIGLMLGSRVIALDAERRVLTLADDRFIATDAIVLATGARARKLPCEGGRRLPSLRNWEDAVRLRTMLERESSLVIIGAELIGLEVAASARARGVEVTVLEAGTRAMARLPGGDLIDALVEAHQAAGVDIRFGAAVEAVEVAGNAYRLILAGGEVSAGAVLVAIGSEPDTDLAEAAGLEVANGVVTTTGGLTSAAGIYAAGDVAAVRDAISGLPRRSEHWRAAQLQGEAVAAAILGLPAPARDLGWAWSDQLGHRFEVAGHPAATDHVVRRDGPRGRSRFYMDGDRVTGAAALDAPVDMRVAMRLMERDQTCSAAVLADPATDLRRLLKAA